MTKGPTTRRTGANIGVRLNQTLGSSQVGAGHNDMIRRVATGQRSQSGVGSRTDLTTISMELVAVATPFSATPSDEFGGSYSYPEGFTPTISGFYSIDVTWDWSGAPPDTIQRIEAVGPPYHTYEAGGQGHVHIDGSGAAVGSVHWQGFLGSDVGEGFAIGGAVPDGSTWSAQMSGVLMARLS